MKKIKKVMFAFGVLFILLFLGGYFYLINKITPDPNQLTIKEDSINTPFEWVSFTTNNGIISNAAMYVPVYLKGCPKKFYMQFDIGHPTTIFYKCVLKQINSKYHNISFQQKSDQSYLSDFDFNINETLVNAKKIPTLDCSVSDFSWEDTTSIIKIGTIGSDIIENKVLMIDYPNKEIFIGNNTPDSLALNTKFSDFKYKYRKVLLPPTRGTESEDIYFDTGTSAFELMTDKDRWNKLAKKGASVNTFEISNWGKIWVANSIATDDSIQFNSTSFPIKNVTYVDGPGILLKLAFSISGVQGLTGNKLFLNKKIIVDTKKLKFAIIN